ncbi:unnamed protein product, partial [Ectocarpus sp. 12 AP-2014]
EFLARVVHPELHNIGFIVDGTKSLMRNPAKPRDGVMPNPTEAVNDLHYSKNKGLGYTHQIYCNVRGKMIRLETGPGAASDRGAYNVSPVYTD